MYKIIFSLSFLLTGYITAATYDYSVEMKESDGTVKHLGDVQVNVVDNQMIDEGYNPELLNQIQNHVKGTYKGYNINVKVEGDIVTLQGTVNSAQDKENIENEIQKFPGIKKINNQLQVTEKLD